MPAWRARARIACALIGLGLLAGCAGRDGGMWNLGLGSRGSPEPAVAAPAAATTDPIALFAAQAQPGNEQQVVLAGGQSANVRLVRAYVAASGRQCREVLVGSGMAERTQLVCVAENGAWVPARPLLRGGSVGRP